MARRTAARLAPGTTIIDYASPTRILKAFGNDMKAIRAEASRERSIIRKRLERMKKAGETQNRFYQHYYSGNYASRSQTKKQSVSTSDILNAMKSATPPENIMKAFTEPNPNFPQNRFDSPLPPISSLSDTEVLEYLSYLAMGIAGGFQSTLSEIKQSRKDIIEALKNEALENEDLEFYNLLNKRITGKQMSQVGRLMGMSQKVVGRLVDSGTVFQTAMKLVLGGKKESLLKKATRLIQELGLDDEDEKLENLKNTFTSTGGYRVSYLKSRGKRG